MSSGAPLPVAPGCLFVVLGFADGAVQAGKAAPGIDLPRTGDHRPPWIAGEVAVAEVIGHELERPRIVVRVGQIAQVADERGIGGPGPLGLVGQAAQFFQQFRHVAGLGLPRPRLVTQILRRGRQLGERDEADDYAGEREVFIGVLPVRAANSSLAPPRPALGSFIRSVNHDSTEVQCAHLLALTGMRDRQYGQSFSVDTAGGGAFFNRFNCLITMKMAKAMIRKSMRVLSYNPTLIVAAPAFFASSNIGEGSRGQVDEDIREVDAAQQQSDRRHDDVGDEGRDNLAEGGADDDADGHVHHVPAHGEFAKLFEHSIAPSIR